MSVSNANDAIRDRGTTRAATAGATALERDQFARQLQQARVGSETALGWLLDTYREYLLAVAHQNLEPDLRTKVATSDLVQQTVLEALAHFGRFNGQSPEEWVGWLCRILTNNLTDARRHYRGSQKRQLDREMALADAPLAALAEVLPCETDSPSAQAMAREEEAALYRALAVLPEADRQVVHWRSLERLSFDQVGRRLGCSADAARKRWARAVEQLGQSLEPADESG